MNFRFIKINMLKSTIQIASAAIMLSDPYSTGIHFIDAIFYFLGKLLNLVITSSIFHIIVEFVESDREILVWMSIRGKKLPSLVIFIEFFC